MENENVYFVDGIFVKESELTNEQIKYFVQKLVKAFNETPLVARDHFSRGLLSTMGITNEVLAALGLTIDLTPPETNQNTSPGDTPSGLIIL